MDQVTTKPRRKHRATGKPRGGVEANRPFEAEIDGFKKWMLRQSKPPSGTKLRTYSSEARNYLVSGLGPADFVDSPVGSGKPASQAMRRTRFYAVRCYLTYSEGDHTRLSVDMKAPAEPPLPHIEIPSIEDTLGMLAWADANVESPWPLFFRVLYDSGFRLGELLSARLEDFDPDKGVLTCHGKGSRYRTNPLSMETVQRLKAYLRWERPVKGAVVLGANDTLFAGKLGGRLQDFQANRKAKEIFEGYGWKRYAVYSKPCHLWRHISGTHQRQMGRGRAEVAENLGHGNVATTKRYDHLNKAGVRAEHHRFHPLGDPDGAVQQEKELTNVGHKPGPAAHGAAARRVGRKTDLSVVGRPKVG